MRTVLLMASQHPVRSVRVVYTSMRMQHSAVGYDASCATAEEISSGSPPRTACAATPIPAVTALEDELPCPMMHKIGRAHV